MSESDLTVTLEDPAATEALAQRLVPATARGARIALCGDLGAGKTTLVRAYLRELGETGTIRSPTYTLLETYYCEGRTVHHLDVYRLQVDDDVADLGLLEMTEGSWWFVEWADRLSTEVVFDLTVSLSHQGDSRKAQLSAHTKLGLEILSNLNLNMN